MHYFTHGTPLGPSLLLLHQLPILLYATSMALAVPIDFQVGNYLHKFFKDFLPNNTNYKRKPGDQEPYRKFYSKIISTDPTATIPSIEGLKFRMADEDLPTLPIGNITLAIYNPYTTTFGTTPRKEEVLQMGEVFRHFMMQKSGIIRNIAGAYNEVLKMSSTSNPEEHRDVFENYDENLEKILSMVNKKMVQKVEAHYNKSATETTTPAGIIKNFVKEMKHAYHEQINNIFTTTPVSMETETQAQVNVTSIFDVSASQELRDQEGMRGLAAMDEHFITRKDLEEQLKDIVTPAEW